MPNITYGKEKGREWWIVGKGTESARVLREKEIPEEHMRLIAILNLAENNNYIPGVGHRSDDALPMFIRYILDIN